LVKKKFENSKDVIKPPWSFLKNENQAVFRAKVVSGYRITIPDVERELLGIKEGDFVWVLIEKVKEANKK